MSSKRKSFARFGMVAKGIVYALVGILTAMAAFGYGGQESGSKGALNFLLEQSYGKPMLFVLGLGLAGYVFWRFYQAFGNHDQIKNDTKGYAKRAAYFISGIVYALLSYYALDLAINGRQSNMGNSSITQATQIIVIVVGVGMAIKAVYDIYRAYSERFRENIQEIEMSQKEQKILMNAGKFGHTARGIVIGLMAYLTLKSGLSSGGQISKKTDAFSYISNEFGTWALGVVALGLIAYAIFMFIKAKYPSMSFK